MPGILIPIDDNIIELQVTGVVSYSDLMRDVSPQMFEVLEAHVLKYDFLLNILLTWKANKANFGNITIFAQEMKRSNTYTHRAYGHTAASGVSGLIRATAGVMGALHPFPFTAHITREEALAKLRSLPRLPLKPVVLAKKK